MQTLRMEKDSVVHVVQKLRRRMGQDAASATDALLKCVFKLPHKIPLYALLIGACMLRCVHAGEAWCCLWLAACAQGKARESSGDGWNVTCPTPLPCRPAERRRARRGGWPAGPA